ncbi:Alpha-(1,3)-fucosyltransferase C, partial [Orchesella cincta]
MDIRSSLSIHTTVPSDPEKAESFNPPECTREFIITSNKSLHSEADVVIFQYVNLKGVALPTKRYPGVPWVLALQESSINTRPLPKSFNGVFNFTWSLRGDSEVHHNFDQMYPRLEKRDEKWIYGKTKLNLQRGLCPTVEWNLANVEDLFRNWKLDSFGGCSHKSCVRNESCFSNLGKEYKFYMALENSLCVDYITEKPSHGWVHNMVPIIYALGNKTMLSPPNSYVDALEFKTMKGLADRIKFLANNPKEYFKYFEWKSVYDLKTPFASSYHCYAFREIRKVTELIRRKE